MAIGLQSVATLDNSVAMGNQAQTQAQRTTTTKTTVQGPPKVETTTASTTPAAGNNTDSIAVGNAARTNGANNLALGTGATTEMVIGGISSSTSAGVTTMVQTDLAGPVQNAMAIGNGARANGNGAIVMGANARAEAKVSQVVVVNGEAWVYNTVGPATNSVVIGTSAASQGTNNVVIGQGAQTQGDTLLPKVTEDGHYVYDPVTGLQQYEAVLKDINSTVVGAGAASVKGTGTALGFQAWAYGNRSTAVGTNTYSVGPGSTAIGSYVDYGVAFGAAARPNAGISPYGRSVALGYGSQSMGGGAYSWGNYDVALGVGSKTGDRDTDHPNAAQQVTAQYQSVDGVLINGSAALGFVANADGHRSVAVGVMSQAHDAMSIAIGSESVAWGVDSIAVGDKAIATWREDIAIGTGTEVWGGMGTTNTAIGVGARIGASGGPDINHAMAIGSQAGASADYALSVGDGAMADAVSATAVGVSSQAAGLSATAAGDHSQAMNDYDAAFGAYALAQGGNSLAVGTNAFAIGINSVATGYNSAAYGDDSVAVGSFAVADSTLGTALGNGAMVMADNAIALGANSQADRANTVSVGIQGGERQITNVAAGTEATDAVNKGQLDVAVANIASIGSAVGDLDAAAVKYDDAAGKGNDLAWRRQRHHDLQRQGRRPSYDQAVNLAQLKSVTDFFGVGGVQRRRRHVRRADVLGPGQRATAPSVPRSRASTTH